LRRRSRLPRRRATSGFVDEGAPLAALLRTLLVASADAFPREFLRRLAASFDGTGCLSS
jgi:hypothetical protein